jgi:hypothetical protein
MNIFLMADDYIFSDRYILLNAIAISIPICRKADDKIDITDPSIGIIDNAAKCISATHTEAGQQVFYFRKMISKQTIHPVQSANYAE